MISDTKMPISSSGCSLFSFRKEERSCGCDLLSEQYPPADDGFSGLRKMISAGCSLPEQTATSHLALKNGFTFQGRCDVPRHIREG